MRYLRGFGRVSSEEVGRADEFFESLSRPARQARRTESAPSYTSPEVAYIDDPYAAFEGPADTAEEYEPELADEGCGCGGDKRDEEAVVVTSPPPAYCEQCETATGQFESLIATIGPEHCEQCEAQSHCEACGQRATQAEALAARVGVESCEQCRAIALGHETRAYDQDEDLPDDDFEQDDPEPTTTPTEPQPYLPTGGRNYTPQAVPFNCGPNNFTVIPATMLPEPTTDPAAAITTALTTAGLSERQRGRVHTAPLLPIAREFGATALAELLTRLRWTPDFIVRWGRVTRRQPNPMLGPRLLIHIPGHFRELARRAPGPAEAYVLECIGWLLMRSLRDEIKAATNDEWWIPPAPAFVSPVPNPMPGVSQPVSRVLTRRGYINTTMPAGQWNGKYSSWHTGLPGRLWHAEVNGPNPGRPYYADLATVPAYVNTNTTRTSISTAWTQRLADTDASHTPHAAGATSVTLAGLQNAVALRRCDNGNTHLPSGAISRLGLQGLELAYNFPMTTSRRKVTRLALMNTLHPVYTAVFATLHALGWNDLVYQTSGAGCFRGIKHAASARVSINGTPTTVNPFSSPNATTVTNINTHFSAAQRATVVRATRTARRMSEHGIGAAVDLNVQENGQRVAGRQYGSMDPRVVALFEAFHFRWGACFNPNDPHHFEYCRSACAPTPVTAGPAPTSTPGLIPSGAGPVIA